MFNREPIAAGVIIGLAGIVLSLPGLSALTRNYSLFYQARAVDYFIYQHSALPSIFYGVLVSGVLLVIGMKVFNDKDF